jgi:hypothetical protein
METSLLGCERNYLVLPKMVAIARRREALNCILKMFGFGVEKVGL